MRKGKNILGLQVTSEVDGTELGAVQDLIFDQETDEVLGLLISDKSWFGLKDAQVVPWNQVRSIGSDAVIVVNADSKIKASEDPRIAAILDRNTALSGTRIRTTKGEDIGTFADLYLDEHTGRVLGYEVSGGFFSDTMSGKHYIPASPNIVMGDVALIPAELADELEERKQNNPGGIKGAVATASDKVSDAYDTTKEKVADVYGNIASASIEKQKEFVVGKIASRDVVVTPETSAVDGATPGITPEGTYTLNESEIVAPTPEAATGTPVSQLESSELAASHMGTSETASVATPAGEIIVHSGETITREHADRAESAGMLYQLVLAAGGTVANDALNSGKETLNNGRESMAAGFAGTQDNAEEIAIGKVAGTDVTAPDGSTIVASGMIITREIMEQARAHNQEKAVIAAAGLGTASAGVNTVKEQAGNLWDSIKAKTAEITGAAQDKRAEFDEQAQQKRINDALGRPTTRVILDPADNVILNTGELITHAAIAKAREAGTLDVLLDSAYMADPEITPEMLRANETGEAALPSQVEPTDRPHTAVVPNDTSPEGSPS